MAAPTKIYDVRMEVEVTNSMAAAVRIALAESGMSQAEYLRAAVAEKLERDANGLLDDVRRTAATRRKRARSAVRG